MKKKKKYLSLALALVFSLTTALPFASGAGELAKPGTYTTASCGSDHTAAIDQNGAFWIWGSDALNEHGQIVNGGGNQTIPVKIMDNVASVSCDFHTTAAITTDDSLWMRGDNLGNSNVRKIMDNVVAVNCKYDYTAAIKTDDSLWMWGSNH